MYSEGEIFFPPKEKLYFQKQRKTLSKGVLIFQFLHAHLLILFQGQGDQRNLPLPGSLQAAAAGTGPGQSLGARTPLGSPGWVVLEPFLAACRNVHQQEVGIRSRIRTQRQALGVRCGPPRHWACSRDLQPCAAASA